MMGLSFARMVSSHSLPLFLVASLQCGLAAPRVWDGGGADNNWTNPTNWVGDVAPLAGDSLIFPPGAARLTTINNYPADTAFNSITIGAQGYTLNGSSLALAGGIITTNAIGNSFVNFGFRLTADQAISVAGTNIGAQLSLTGAIDTGGFMLTFSGTGVHQVESPIGGSGGLIKLGTASTLLYASNTFSGTVEIREGGLSIYNNRALGDTNGATIVFAAGRLVIAGGVRSVPEPLALSGTLAGGFAAHWTGPIELTATNCTISVSSGSPFFIDGLIFGSGGFTKTLADPLRLTANNTYSGLTIIGGGMLRVTGNQPLSAVQLKGGILSGSGTVGPVSFSLAVVGNDIRISPASTTNFSAVDTAILTCSDLALDARATIDLELNGMAVGAGYDQLRVNGTVSLAGPRLNVLPGFAPPLGTPFVILDNDGADAVSGLFTGASRGLDEGAIVTTNFVSLQISYHGGTGNDVVLTAVATPPTGITRVWDGGGANGFWSNPTNWAGNVAPAAGDDLFFPNGPTRFFTTNDYPIGMAVNSLTLGGTNYRVFGTNLFLNAGIMVTNNTDDNFVLAPIRLHADQTNSIAAPAGQLSMSAAIDLAGRTLTFAGAGLHQMQSRITGDGGLQKVGAGTLLLYSSNTFNGPVEIRDGAVNIYYDRALGTTNSNTHVFAGGRLVLTSGVTLDEPLTIEGSLRSGSGNCTLNGPIDLPVSAAFQISSPLTINGVISGPGGFTKSFTTNLTLNGNNTYSGDTIVGAGAGTLWVNGQQPASAVYVHPGATLGGLGRVGLINGMGGTISPGTNGPGILTSSAGFISSPSTHLNIQLNGVFAGIGYDQLSVAGPVSLNNCRLDVSVGFVPAVGDFFVILNKTGSSAISGSFAGLPESGLLMIDSSLVFQITYVGGNGNDVVLTRVNLPSRISFLASSTNGFKRLQGIGEPGLLYTIEAATNLIPAVVWDTIGTDTADGSGVYEFIDTDALMFPMRFYRVITP